MDWQLSSWPHREFKKVWVTCNSVEGEGETEKRETHTESEKQRETRRKKEERESLQREVNIFKNPIHFSSSNS